MLEQTGSFGDTRQLVERANRASESGWSELIARVDAKLRVLAHFRLPARVQERVDIDDLLQDTYIEAVRRLRDFEYRGAGSLLRWLAGILHHKVQHAGRAAARQRVVPAAYTTWPTLHDALMDASSGASTAARQQEQVAHVRALLQRLPQRDREVLLLKHFEGLTGREAAARLDVDESTVSVRYRKALERCAVHLRGVAP